MTPELVLHAGLAPTDGPMLNRALARLRPQLRRRGVACVMPPDFRNLADLGAAVAAERRATRRCRTVFVSFPTVALRRDLSTEGSPRRVAATLAAIGLDGPARISLTVQRPDRLYEHAYLDLVARGETRPPAAALCGVPDLADVVDRIAALPAVGAVTVRPWELVGAGAVAYVDDLLAVVGLRGKLDLHRLAHRFSAGRRYSAAALPVATALLPLAETDEQRADLRRLVLTHLRADADADSRFLDETHRATLLAERRPSNRDLLGRYCPELPVGAYDDDAGTAALGRVLAPLELPWPPARNSRPDLARRARRRAYRGWQRLTAAG